MEPSEEKNQGPSRKQHSPTLSAKDPSLSTSRPTTSHPHHQDQKPHLNRVDIDKDPDVPFRTKCITFLYNSEDNSYCGRTCISWLYITVYAIVYLAFLSTFMMIVLFSTLWYIRMVTDFKMTEKLQLLTYSERGIGLSMTPVSELYQPLIWYRKNQSEDYQSYVKTIDEFLIIRRRKRQVDLGPCGVTPFGYAGNKPCVIIRINKNLHWAGKPLVENSSLTSVAPFEVQNWIKRDKKLWLYCEGFHPYDKEHVGSIRYFPDPPGFDPTVFPLGPDSDSPLVALQISDFTLGLSLSVECKLWYENGPATVDFMLYVASNEKTVSNRTSV